MAWWTETEPLPLVHDSESHDYQVGYEAGRAEERLAIVAWLRDTGDPHSLVYQAGMTVTQAADRLAEEAPT